MYVCLYVYIGICAHMYIQEQTQCQFRNGADLPQVTHVCTQPEVYVYFSLSLLIKNLEFHSNAIVFVLVIFHSAYNSFLSQ